MAAARYLNEDWASVDCIAGDLGITVATLSVLDLDDWCAFGAATRWCQASVSAALEPVRKEVLLQRVGRDPESLALLADVASAWVAVPSLDSTQRM